MYAETTQPTAIQGLNRSPTTADFLSSPEKPSFFEFIILGRRSLIYEQVHIKSTITISKLWKSNKAVYVVNTIYYFLGFGILGFMGSCLIILGRFLV